MGYSFPEKKELIEEDRSSEIQDIINRPTLLSQWKPSNWKNIRVGDFVLLKNNDRIPADIVIIASSEPDSTCYVETKNLDGETNLKIKRGLKDLTYIKSTADCKKLGGFINAEPPNNNLYTFSGTFTFVDKNGTEKSTVPLGPNSLLLRGCVIRNTSWIIGIALYTGSDSKIMLNSGPTPSKRSKIDKQITPQVEWTIFFINICRCY
jgi:phospholipid-translocating ATPase